MSIKNYDIVGALIVLSLMGAQLFSIDVGVMQLSAYRFLLVVSFIFLVAFRAKFARQQQLVGQNTYLVFMAIWFTYSMIHGVIVENTAEWLRGIVFLLSGYAISILIYIYINDSSKFLSVSRFVLVAGLLIGLLALNEIINGDYYFLRERNLEFYQDESIRDSSINSRIPVVMFGNPNNYALFIYFSIIITFVLHVLEDVFFKKVMYFLVVAFFTFLLISTQSRSGLLGVGIFFGLYILCIIIKEGVVSLKSVALLIFVSILVMYYILTSVSGGALSFLEFDSDVGSDLVRSNLIINGFQLLVDSYYLGVGLGNIEIGMNSRDLIFTFGVTSIHNWWMELLVSSGIFIFILYIYFYVKTLKIFFRISVISVDKTESRLNRVGFSFMISFVAASVGPSSLLPTEWFWALFGLMMCVPFLKIRA